MPSGSSAIFSALKPVFANCAARLAVKADTPTAYTLVAKAPSPFPQHKGEPMFFGSVRVGKAYVSLHLMPLYMCPALTGAISPALTKRMQGKTCFNFKTEPDPQLIAELRELAEASLKQWAGKNWI